MTARVVVVGGGVSGLTVAYRLLQADATLDVTVLEAADEPVGKLAETEVGGLRLPAGADSFLARKPWAVDLCRELGLALESPSGGGAWLWTDRGLVPFAADTAFGIPGDVGQVLRWPGVSRAGRRRALADLVKAKRRGTDDESLGSLLRRRLGDEVAERAVGPLLAGLYAGDMDRLSVRATFPELATWEASQGSLIRGAQAALRTQRQAVEPGPLFQRPVGGVGALPRALAHRLGDRVRTRAAASGVEPRGSRWTVRTDADAIDADAVVLAVPADATVGLLRSATPAAAADLAAIPLVSTAVVLLVYPEDTASVLPDGTGFVVPRGAAPMTAATWLSAKWPDPAFGSRAVLRCYVGAAGEEGVVEESDDDIVAACARHLTALLPLPASPAQAAVIRWRRAMPQYELDHLDRVARLRAALPPGVFVSGQPYDGVGVPDCVRAAGEQAAAVLAHLEPVQETQP
ncbi:MAG TPA: protoporphyrinogen oxidase [Actinomycetota bacterium]